MFNFMWRRCKKTLSRVYEYAWLTLAILIGLLYAFGYLTMYYFNELEILENYTWWFSVTITTVGYGDYSPSTPYGRFAAGLIMFFGIGAIGLVIGKISESILGFANKNIKGLRKMNHENHTLIMGYRKGSTEKVISELLAHNPSEKIILCSYSQKENPLRKDDVGFIMGELASDDVMSRANAVAASNIIIHGADDNETFITAYSFRIVNTNAHMVCYLNNEDHSEKIKNLPSVHSSFNQVILPANDYLMAQELQDRESSGVVQQLISNLDGENLYRYDIPDGDLTIDFQSVFIGMKKKYGATVLAVKDSTLTLNPDLLSTVKPGMALFYAAPKRLLNIDLSEIGA